MTTLPSKHISLQEIVGRHYADYWHNKQRYRILKGSRGSKKSKTTALNIITKMIEYPQANVLCIRRYGSTLRDSMFADLKWAIHRLGVDDQWTNITAPMEIRNVSTGQKILFRGLDDPLKLTSITVEQGYLCWVWIEEAYEITNEDDFNKVDMSIRGEVPEGLYKQITLTFNPWSENCWIKSRFWDNPDEDTFLKTTTWKQNEWLDDADRKIFEKMKAQNPRRYRIEGEGEWGIAEGLIYENTEVKDFDVDVLRQQKGIKSAFGLDFGFTDPNAFVGLLVDSNAYIIYVFDEWYQTGCTNKQIAQAIKDKGYGSQRVVCDSAEPKSIAELNTEGIKAIPADKGRDSVKHGIQAIQNYKIIVHPRCVEFWKEISNYTWSKDRSGKTTDTPDHEFSHGMDAMRYAMSGIGKETHINNLRGLTI